MAQPALYKLDGGMVEPTGVTATVPFYGNGNGCSDAEIRSPSTFFAQCKSTQNNVVRIVSSLDICGE